MPTARRDGPPLTLALAGDVMLGRLVNESLGESRDYARPWGDVLPVLRAADVFCVNLECALTRRTERWTDGGYKPFYFRAEPEAVRTLELGRVAFASVANNHIGDFGREGLREVSLEPEYFDEVKVALAVAREQADLVIFSIHWGPNMRERPTPDFQAFARAVTDAGADVFWGHSAHVVQGIELWHGRPIFYDTGDLVDDYAVDRRLRNDLSAVFLLSVTTSPVALRRIEIVPVRIAAFQATLARGDDRAWFLERFGVRCAALGTEVVQEPGRVHVAAGHPAART